MTQVQLIVDCFYGLGVGYRGNVNITRSGRPCQAWNSQCPHRHWRIPKDVTDGQEDFSMCRNPDSSAPDGPWCYTTDPNVWWEYCNVSKCPPRGTSNLLSGDKVIRNLKIRGWQGQNGNESNFRGPRRVAKYKMVKTCIFVKDSDINNLSVLKANLVPRVLSLLRESTLVTAGHVSKHANPSRTEGGSST